MEKSGSHKSLWERLVAKAIRDRSKLVQRAVIDKNGHRKTVWVRVREEKKMMPIKELREFIKEALADRKAPYKRIKIGTLSKEAKMRIVKKYGKNTGIEKISTISIDNSSIVHALTKKSHHIKPNDILFALNVINTSSNITLSDKKHQNNEVLVFRKNIDGEITFLTEVHIKNGYLLVFNVWRQQSPSRKTP